jgi:carbamoyl-phosphate synthase large subunit
MAIGRTFKEALQKALRSLEVGRSGLGADGKDALDPVRLREKLITPNWERIFYVRFAFLSGMSVEEVAELTKIDSWFLRQIEELVALERVLSDFDLADLPVELLRKAASTVLDRPAHLPSSERGASAPQKAVSSRTRGSTLRGRVRHGHLPVFHLRRRGRGASDGPAPGDHLGRRPEPDRQGIEFDYCCCHASFPSARRIEAS